MTHFNAYFQKIDRNFYFLVKFSKVFWFAVQSSLHFEAGWANLKLDIPNISQIVDYFKVLSHITIVPSAGGLKITQGKPLDHGGNYSD